MTGDDLRAAIEGPARQAGLRLEPGLVDLLVSEVEGEPGALPLLSHVLAETWGARGRVSPSMATGTGGIRGAVAQSAEAVYDWLRRAAVRCPGPVAATGRTRRRGRAAAPGCRWPRSPATRSQRLLDLLDALRLVTTDEETVRWRTRRWPGRGRGCGRGWTRTPPASSFGTSPSPPRTGTAGRPDSELYRGNRLSSAQEWRSRTSPSLSPTEAAFLDASAALAAAEQAEVRARTVLQARQHRRLRGALAGTALALVLALVAGLVAVEQGQRSARTARTALVDRLVAQSAALRSTRRDLAALLAVEAYRLGRPPRQRGHCSASSPPLRASWASLPRTPAAAPCPLGAGRLLPGGTTLLAVGVDGVARLLDLGPAASWAGFLLQRSRRSTHGWTSAGTAGRSPSSRGKARNAAAAEQRCRSTTCRAAACSTTPDYH